MNINFDEHQQVVSHIKSLIKDLNNIKLEDGEESFADAKFVKQEQFNKYLDNILLMVACYSNPLMEVIPDVDNEFYTFKTAVNSLSFKRIICPLDSYNFKIRVKEDEVLMWIKDKEHWFIHLADFINKASKSISEYVIEQSKEAPEEGVEAMKEYLKAVKREQKEFMTFLEACDTSSIDIFKFILMRNTAMIDQIIRGI